MWTPFPSVAIIGDDTGALSVRSPFLQGEAPLLTGDVVDIALDKRFRLLPRGDNVVKIDGKRVSLTRVEAALNDLPEVEAAATLTLHARNEELAAVVALTDACKTRLRELGPFRLSRQLRVALAPTLEPPERPKRWRFVDVIPVDTQGKRIRAALRALFDSGADPLNALDLDIRIHTDAQAEIAFTLPAELIFFRGHFPDQAILPGVAQAHLAVLIAEKLWGDWPSDANLARLKFRRVLVPGDSVVLKLRRNPTIGRVSFLYEFGDVGASQGEIGGFKP
jgi:hypothetical protein